VIGKSEKKNIVHMVDFGLSKRFRNSKTGEHIPYKDGKSFCGTARYASIYSQFGIQQSRRDDLESLGYCILYFLRGNLPWQNVKGKTKKEKYNNILEMKIQYTAERLCEGQPEQILKYLTYCRNLQFEEKPDYKYLRNLFNNANGVSPPNLNIFDWTLINDDYESRSRSTENDEKEKKHSQINIDSNVGLF